MEALVLVGGTLLVWTVGFWAVGQLDRFFKEKNAPCRREREGQTPQKKKSSVPERGKSGGTEVKQGEGPRLCFYIVWAPPVFETGLRPQKQKSLALLYRFSAEDGPGPLQRLQFALPPLLTGSGVAA